MRKEKFLTVIDDGKEILFKLKQMPAVKQEKWINRLIMILLHGGAVTQLDIGNLQDKLEQGKWDNLLTVFGSLKFEEVEPLYNELLECVEHVPDPTDRRFTVPQTAETISAVIGDFRNLYKLRLEALKVNFDFFKDGESSPIQKEQIITISKTT